MSQDRQDDSDERGAVVLAPEPVARGCFALLVPGNMKWEVSDFAGGYRLDFRPMRPAERVARLQERSES